MTTLRQLTTVLDFETNTGPLDEITHQLEQMKHRLDLLSGIEVLKGIFELAERFAGFGEATESAAVQAGLTSEAFQQMAFAASQNAVGQEELSGALAKLARNIAEARDGSKTAKEAFKAVGITEAQVAGFANAGDAMQALADKVQGIQDPIKRTQVLMSLMGRGSANMAKLLSQGGEAIREDMARAGAMGAVVSNKGIKDLAEMEDAMSGLGQIAKSTAATLAAEFAPSIRDMAKELGKWWAANRAVIEQNVKKWVHDITYGLGYLWAIIRNVSESVMAFVGAYGHLIGKIGEVLIALGGLGLALEAGEKAIGAIKTVVEFFVGTLQSLATVVTAPFKLFLWGVGAAQAGLVSLLVRMALLTETAFPALSAAFVSLGAIIEATPIGWLATGLAALVVVSHDLWALWHGKKLEDTWIGQAIIAIKGLSLGVLRKLGLAGDGRTDEEREFKPRDVPRGEPPAYLEGDPDIRERRLTPDRLPSFMVQADASKKLVDAGLDNFQDMMDKQKPALGAASDPSGARTVENNVTYNVDAPMTITVPPNTNPDMVRDAVRDSVAAHLDEVHRRAKINQLSPMVR
jgi:hypothetical protein